MYSFHEPFIFGIQTHKQYSKFVPINLIKISKRSATGSVYQLTLQMHNEL